ncbi:MAG: hypothetical protein H7831_05245 [Magnetococcus sp. WYHC-3]
MAMIHNGAWVDTLSEQNSWSVASPVLEAVDIHDIVLALSMAYCLTRSPHRFYSVAGPSVHASRLVISNSACWGLPADMAEG